MEQKKGEFFSATRISLIALFGALSGVLYIFGFPISVAFPSFLELNFSDIPALVGTFALGPVSGAIIVGVKILVKLVFKGTSTIFVGELADLLIGLAFIVVAGFVYQKKRTFRGAILALVLGSVASVALSVLANWLILVPFYVQLFFNGTWDGLVGMMNALFPACTKETFYTFYLWCSVLPFNAMRCLIAAIISILVYKRISRAINRLCERFAPRGEGGEQKNTKSVWIALLIGAGVVLLLLCFALLRFFLWS